MKVTRLVMLLGAAAMGMMASPVQARPRDEVMSGAYRCAAIGNSRVWLDCYYGAAQPQRAALGMTPAPAAQVALVSSPPAGNAPPGEIAVRDAVMSGAFRCSGMDDRPWLDCYYAAARPMRETLGLASGPTPRPAPVPVVAAAPAPASQFGLPAKPIGLPANQVLARMESYSFDKLGIFTVTLENGQVWRQVDGDTDHARWKAPAASYLVHITHGFLGSFNLQVKGSSGLFKVLRVR